MHELEVRYALTADEIFEAIDRRFRLRVALEGAVAEVHLRKKIEVLQSSGVITGFEQHDINGHPDFSIWPTGSRSRLLVECKSVRDEGYQEHGQTNAFKVETQKTRAAKSDPSSRYYQVGYFDILAVCLGKMTGNWVDFLFVKSRDLAHHPQYSDKLAVMQRVPLPTSSNIPPWHRELRDVIASF